MNYRVIKFFGAVVLLLALNRGFAQEKAISANEFESALKNTNDEQLIDVRTADEFAKGHIEGALNVDINGTDFKKHVATLDKARPVMVYCLSGGRSSRAVDYLRDEGFTKVTQLEGGILQWKAADKPVVVKTVSSSGLTVEAFNKKVANGKIVLVDFYAKWCAPCKKLGPELDALAEANKESLTLIKLNADENSNLIDSLKIEALPGILIFKEGQRVWTHFGMIDRKSIEAQLRKYQ